MDLILWRHADAEDGVPDEERKLTSKGKKQAERISEWLKERLPRDALVLSSTARRARETAQALTRKYATSADIGTSSTPQSLLKAAGWPDGKGTVVVVGHQPTLGQTVALVLSGKEDDWGVKKGALWWLESRDRDDVIVRAVMSPDLL